MIDVGFLGAFLGGLLALISPCSALLLPSFFAYSFDRVGMLARRTLFFYVGMLVVLMPMGAGVAAIGSLLTQHRSTVTMVGGLVMIAFGIAIIAGFGFRVPAAERAVNRLTPSSALSVLALGMVYALAGFCSGPVLGSVLTVAAIGSDPGYGALLMAAYALGMAAPLFVLAIAWDRFGLSRKRWLRGRELTIGPIRTHSTSLITGLVFIGIGLLFTFTEGTANLGGLTSVDQQFDIQSSVQGLTQNISNGVVLLVIVLIALAVVLVRLWRGRTRGERPESERSEDEPVRSER